MKTRVLVGLCLLLSGCVNMAKNHLASVFAVEFSCPNAEVSGPAPEVQYTALFRVEGCDQVAFYNCNQQFCSLDLSRSMTEQERAAAAKRHEPQLAAVQRSVERTVLGQISADDWRIEVASLPNDATHLLFGFSSQRELTPGPCRTTVSLDGTVLESGAVDYHTEHQADFVVSSEPLRTMRADQSLRGAVCGADFTLNETARQQLTSILSTKLPPRAQ